MSKQTNLNHDSVQRAVSSINVYGLIERECVNEIDRVADQMLMPRSWVVTQILHEWFEHRRSEGAGQEQSWEESYQEILGREALAGLTGRREALLEAV